MNKDFLQATVHAQLVLEIAEQNGWDTVWGGTYAVYELDNLRTLMVSCQINSNDELICFGEMWGYGEFEQHVYADMDEAITT